MDTVLYSAMRECKNYFYEKAKDTSSRKFNSPVVLTGEFVISNGKLTLNPAPIVGQHIRIIGSRVNDGVYLVEDSEITLKDTKDEVFNGKVAFLVVPADFLELVEEIRIFRKAQNPAAGNIASEKIGSNYSYTKSTNADGVAAGWKEVFRSKLHPFRKHFEEEI